MGALTDQRRQVKSQTCPVPMGRGAGGPRPLPPPRGARDPFVLREDEWLSPLGSVSSGSVLSVNTFTLTWKLPDLSAGSPPGCARPRHVQPSAPGRAARGHSTWKTSKAPLMTDKCVLLATAQKRLTCTNNKKAMLVTVGPKTKHPVTSLVGKLANNVLFLDKWVTASSHQSFLTF